VTLLAGSRHGSAEPCPEADDGVRRAAFRNAGFAGLGGRSLRRALAQFAPGSDLMHIHTLWNGASIHAGRYARRNGLPYLVTPHGMLHRYCMRSSAWRKRLCWWLVERKNLRHAAGIHFLNRAEQQGSALVSDLGTPAFVVPNGVDLEPFEDVRPNWLRSQHPSLSDRRVMLYLGRLHWIKGLDVQLEALGLLSERLGDLVWVLVGPDAGEWEGLRRRADGMGLVDRVLWLGPMHGRERFDALAAADVVVMTSFYECHSLVVNEALAAGRPLVITESCNFSEVADAGAGLIVERAAPQVARAVAEVLEDPAKAAQMGEAGRRLARDDLDWERAAGRMAQVYERVLGGQPPVPTSARSVRLE